MNTLPRDCENVVVAVEEVMAEVNMEEVVVEVMTEVKVRMEVEVVVILSPN